MWHVWLLRWRSLHECRGHICGQMAVCVAHWLSVAVAQWLAQWPCAWPSSHMYRPVAVCVAQQPHPWPSSCVRGLVACAWPGCHEHGLMAVCVAQWPCMAQKERQTVVWRLVEAGGAVGVWSCNQLKSCFSLTVVCSLKCAKCWHSPRM